MGAIELLGYPLVLIIPNSLYPPERLAHTFQGWERLLYQLGDERAKGLAAVIRDDAQNLMLAGCQGDGNTGLGGCHRGILQVMPVMIQHQVHQVHHLPLDFPWARRRARFGMVQGERFTSLRRACW